MALQYDPKLKTAEGDQLIPAQQGEFGAYYERYYNQFVKLANPPAGYSPSAVSMAQQTEASPVGSRPELALGNQVAVGGIPPVQPISAPISQVTTPPATPAVPSTATPPPSSIPKQTSLVDIYNSRLDLQQAFPNALTPGSPTNQSLNDWWNTIGKTEYPGTSLVAPGTTGIQDPRTLATPGPTQPEIVPPTTPPPATVEEKPTETTKTQYEAQGNEIGKTTTTTGAPKEPESPLASIQAVFGQDWQPAPAFTSQLQAQGVYGAVRIAGQNEVYTLGPGGTLETVDSYVNKFGTSEQAGIVGEISVEQARQLGINVGDDGKPVPINENSDVTKYDFAEDPIKAYTQMYTDVLKASGVLSFKEEYEKLSNQLADKIAEIDSNPWLSEGLRQRRIQAENNKFETKLSLYRVLYEQGIQQANFITNGAYNAYADKTKIDAIALQNATQNAIDLAKLQGGTDMTTDMKEYALYIEQGGSGSLFDYQREVANFRRPSNNITIVGASGLTGAQLGQLNNIADNARLDKDFSLFPDVRGAYEQARQAYQQNNSAGDIVLMRTIAKITDPTSAVREEEFRTFQSAVGTLPRYGVQITSQLIGKGQLTQQGRNMLFSQVENIYKQRLAAYNSKADQYQAQADRIAPGEGVNFVPTYTAPEEAPLLNQSMVPPAPENQSFIDSARNFLFGF